MKRTIQGTRYDSERSLLLGSAYGKNWYAALYRTPRSGKYFLSGKGDEMSVFRGKFKIVPLDAVTAKSWALTYLNKEV